MGRAFNPYAYGHPRVKYLQVRSVSVPIVSNNTTAQSALLDTQKPQLLESMTSGVAIATHDDNKIPLVRETELKIADSYDMPTPVVEGLHRSRFASVLGASASKSVESRTTKSFTQSYLAGNPLGQDGLHQEDTENQQNPTHIGSSKLDSDDQCDATAGSNIALPMENGSDTLRERTNGVIVNVTEPIKHEISKTTMPSASRTVSNRGQMAPDVNNEIYKQPSTEELVHQARVDALKRIQLRSKAKEKNSTTSLRDLEIARTPYQSGTQAANEPTFHHMAHSLHPDGIGDRKSTPPMPPPTSTTVVTQAKQSDRLPRHTGSKKGWQPHHQVPVGTPAVQDTKNNRWANKADLKPVEVEVDSNAWGSSIPSNASQASNDSLLPLHAGKVVRNRNVVYISPHPLAEWNGTMQAPPADWNDRPRFDNHNSPEFHDDFARWLEDVCQLTIKANITPTMPLSTTILMNINNAPDGISMVPHNTTTNKTNVERYGYHEDEIADVLKYVQPLQSSDFDDWGKLDLERPENAAIKNETTKDLVSNWVKQVDARRKVEYALMEQQEQVTQALFDSKPVPNPNRPKINVYLRPAMSDDVSQMASIYNWYIEHTPRPAEIKAIDEEDMQDRLDDVRACKLPFIVAIERNIDGPRLEDQQQGVQGRKASGQNARKIDPLQDAKFAREKVVGWACAQDFTAADFVERVSVELEVYTDPGYRQLGIGRCLIDKLIEACDRGYFKRGGYPFHCPPEKTHLYSGGGGRDLVKLVFIFRKWKHPKNMISQVATSRPAKSNPGRKPNDQENDYDVWIKDWLETWGFEVEGILKGAGAKHGRFVDLVHFGRETSWHPAEGRIPDPIPSI